jgi:hypothetical protein
MIIWSMGKEITQAFFRVAHVALRRVSRLRVKVGEDRS